MKAIYFAVFSKNEKDEYVVTYPDFKNINAFGVNLEEALRVAKDVLEGALIIHEDLEMDIPVPRTYDECKVLVNNGEKCIFPIEVNTTIARSKGTAPNDKKTLVIDHYLNILAKEQDINVSKVLNNALRVILAS